MAEDNPYSAPLSANEHPNNTAPRPSLWAIVAIVVLSFFISVVATPADPFSMILAYPVILIFGLGSYFAGYLRGRRRS